MCKQVGSLCKPVKVHNFSSLQSSVAHKSNLTHFRKLDLSDTHEVGVNKLLG